MASAASNLPHMVSTPDGVVIDVKVVPGGSREQIAGLLGSALKVKVSAPPEGGKANKAVCALLAKSLGVPSRDVSVAAGHSQPRKRITVAGLAMAHVQQKLAVILG